MAVSNVLNVYTGTDLMNITDPANPIPVTNASDSTPGDIYLFDPVVGNFNLRIDDDGTDGEETLFEDNVTGQTLVGDIAAIIGQDGDTLELESILVFRPEGGAADGSDDIDVYIINNVNIVGPTIGDWFIPTQELTPGLQYQLISADIDPIPIPYIDLPCFVEGTKIATPDGPRAIEELVIGDLVKTMDGRRAPVRWIGQRTAFYLPDQAPIIFQPGVVGNRDPLCISPLHRLVFSGAESQLLFGLDACLVMAKDLTHLHGVRRGRPGKYTYFHLLFDRHEIISANGVWTESLLVGDVSSSGFGPEARREIRGLHPNGMTPALPLLSSYEGRLIARASGPGHTVLRA